MRCKALARPPHRCGGLFIGIITHITSEMLVMTLENIGVEIQQQDWHALKTEEVLSHLKVQGIGLTSEEAKRRLEHFGPNQLKEAARPSFLQMLWEQLNNFVVILLIVASVISALLDRKSVV